MGLENFSGFACINSIELTKNVFTDIWQTISLMDWTVFNKFKNCVVHFGLSVLLKIGTVLLLPHFHAYAFCTNCHRHHFVQQFSFKLALVNFLCTGSILTFLTS